MSLNQITSATLAHFLQAAHASDANAPRSWLLPTYGRREAGLLAAAVATESDVLVAGDHAERFTMMSAIKPFLLLHLLELLGHDAVFEHVDKQPSDLPFYSTEQLIADGLRPRNPMLNSGAMLLSTRLRGESPQRQCEGFLLWLNRLAGTTLKVHAPTLHEMLTRPDGENTALANLLAHAGHITDARAAFEVYFRVCCIAGTVADLARLGLLLALPHADISPENQATTTALTLTCGLYEASAAWASEVGVPSKSGVSGCIIALVPGQGAVATFTPWLDPGGNPRTGMSMLRSMAEELGLGAFDSAPAPRAYA